MEAPTPCVLGALFLLAVLCTVDGYSSWRRFGGDGPGGVNHHHHYHGDAYNHYGRRGRSDESSESRDESSESRHRDSDDDHDERRYRFAVGNNFGPFEYIDEEGKAKGFNIDILYAVCAEANKKCKWMVDQYSHCWDSDGEHGYPGVGMLADYYDAWVGYLPTTERKNSLNFTMEYTKNFEVAVYYNEGSPHYTAGDPTDLSGKKIGFVDGWVWNKQCLSEQDAFNGDFTAVQFESDWFMLDALRAEEIDAFVAVKQHGRTKTDEELKIHATDPAFTCTPSGAAMVARYNNQDIIDWWNEAFGRMKENGKYRRLCEQAKKDHGNMGQIDCLV